MTIISHSTQTFHREHHDSSRATKQITRWPRNLTFGRSHSQASEAARRTARRTERLQELYRRVDLLAGAWNKLGETLDEYVRLVPLCAREDSLEDAHRFLGWLETSHGLSLRVRDHVSCLRAQCQVEEMSRDRRALHRQFLELAAAAPFPASDLGHDSPIQIHINPLWVWSRLLSDALLTGPAHCPVDVLFFAAGTSIQYAAFCPADKAMFIHLTCYAPCRLGTLLTHSRGSESHCVAFCRRMADLGVVAFAHPEGALRTEKSTGR